MGRHSPVGPVSSPGNVWQNETILNKGLTEIFFCMGKNNCPSHLFLKIGQKEWQRVLESLEPEANTWQGKFWPNQLKSGIWKQFPYNSRCPVNVLNENVHHYQAPVEGNVNKNRYW